MTTGKAWATAGFLLGIGASVAGNVAHAQHTIGAQLAAAFYPVALLLTVEILARTVWPSGRSWWAVRFGGAGLVAMVAAIVSYSHLRGLLVGYGEQAVTAVLGPLSVDGLMVVSGFALLAIGRTGHSNPKHASDLPNRAHVREGATPSPSVDSIPADLRELNRRSVTTGREPLAVEGPQVSEQEMAANRHHGADPDPLVATARDRFAEVLSAGSVPSIRAIRRELRIGHPRAARVKELLSTSGDDV